MHYMYCMLNYEATPVRSFVSIFEQMKGKNNLNFPFFFLFFSFFFFVAYTVKKL